jgi:hypothetical protein
MNVIEIVVARYNECLSWTNEYPFNQFKYIVYNKGVNEEFEKKHVTKIITLPNVGKCDHTYLYHIVNKYENLANIIVFFPGSLNIQSKKNKAIKLLQNILYYKKACFIGETGSNILKKFYNFKLDNWKTSDITNQKLNNESKLELSPIRPYGKWFVHNFGNIFSTWNCYGGIFSIAKQDILRYKKIKYQKLLEQLSMHSNPEVGHYIERSWAAIFYPLDYTIKITECSIKQNIKLQFTSNKL